MLLSKGAIVALSCIVLAACSDSGGTVAGNGQAGSSNVSGDAGADGTNENAGSPDTGGSKGSSMGGSGETNAGAPAAGTESVAAAGESGGPGMGEAGQSNNEGGAGGTLGSSGSAGTQSSGGNGGTAMAGNGGSVSAGNGGTEIGGTNAGGTNAAGTNAGGTNAGGTSAGGTNAGGTNAGGTNAGGTNAGGTNAGGTNAGGSNEGGNGGGGAASGGGGGVAGGNGGAGGGGCQGDQDCAGAPVDQCQVPFCNLKLGVCEAKSQPNDTPCDDDDLCTTSDSCQSGLCTGTKPIVCKALDQCHVAGLCNAQTGVCSNPPIKDTTPCDDGDACTLGDACQKGKCAPASTVVCSASDQCHAVGTCDSKSGACSDPPAKDGKPCDDGHACSGADTCTAGTCGGPALCTMSVTPDVLTLAPDETFSFTATIAGANPATANWWIKEGAAGGTIDPVTGDYQAPDALGTYHVIATSNADSAVSASATVTVTKDPVRVSLCPSHATILADESLGFTPLVTGTGNHSVTWSASAGSISVSGLYKPSGTGSFTVTATSVAEPAKQATATIDVVDPVLPSISGNVSYAGAKKGVVRITTLNGNSAGTSISGAGPYRIRGIDVGVKQSVYLFAYMDTVGTGKYSVGADPAGSFTIPTFSGADTNGVNITLKDPSPVVLKAISGISLSPGDGIAVVRYNALRDNNNYEIPDSYHVYIDTTPTPSSASYVDMISARAGSQQVAVFQGLTNTQLYWVAIAPVLGGVEGPLSAAGPVQIGTPAGGHSVSGTIDFTGLNVTGALYAIAYSPTTGVIYSTRYTPAAGATSQAYTLAGLADDVYRLGAVVDQDDNGEFGPHDPLTLQNGGDHPFTISGADISGEDVSIPPTWSNGQVTTNHSSDTNNLWTVDFRVNSGTKLPLSAWLAGGPGVPTPVDLGVELSDSNMVLRRSEGLPSTPSVGDEYIIDVRYEDGSVCDLPLKVTGVIYGLPVLQSPNGAGTGTPIPTLKWKPPVGVPSYYVYEGQVENVQSGYQQLWNFNATSADTSILYNNDNKASQAVLLSGIKYEWQLRLQDRFGNSSVEYSYFTLP